MRTPRLLLAPLLLALCGCSGLGKVDYSGLLTGGRDGWQHPDRVIESLAIREGDVVADIGAGSGYFVPRLSRAVGASGRVYAVEVDAETVAELRELVEREQLTNVEVVLGEYGDPLLPDAQVDLVVTVLTYHHIDQRAEYFAHVRGDLSSRGRVAHLDDRDDLTGILGLMVTDGHFSNVDAMVGEMSSAGYERVESYDFLPAQSFQIFAPTSAAPVPGE
jgi:ubiquinone/menaquinone biosynthesis C-methylase UbiE